MSPSQQRVRQSSRMLLHQWKQRYYNCKFRITRGFFVTFPSIVLFDTLHHERQFPPFSYTCLIDRPERNDKSNPASSRHYDTKTPSSMNDIGGFCPARMATPESMLQLNSSLYSRDIISHRSNGILQSDQTIDYISRSRIGTVHSLDRFIVQNQVSLNRRRYSIFLIAYHRLQIANNTRHSSLALCLCTSFRAAHLLYITHRSVDSVSCVDCTLIHQRSPTTIHNVAQHQPTARTAQISRRCSAQSHRHWLSCSSLLSAEPNQQQPSSVQAKANSPIPKTASIT